MLCILTREHLISKATSEIQRYLHPCKQVQHADAVSCPDVCQEGNMQPRLRSVHPLIAGMPICQLAWGASPSPWVPLAAS